MNKLLLIPIIIITLILLLFLTRLIFPSQIDDVSPEILCKQEYLEKTDILWIIPKYNNKPISENKEWCQQILSLNKTPGLHGIQHTYKEFNQKISQKQLDEAIKIFEQCFNQTPTFFKPPRLKISETNKKLIQESGMKLKLNFNQLTHKIYHCGDTGMLPNWVVEVF